MIIHHIQKKLFNLLAQDKIQETINYLKDILNEKSDIRNEIVNLERRFNSTKKERRLNITGIKYLNLEFNKITQSLIEIISNLKDFDVDGNNLEKDYIPNGLSIIDKTKLLLFLNTSLLKQKQKTKKYKLFSLFVLFAFVLMFMAFCLQKNRLNTEIERGFYLNALYDSLTLVKKELFTLELEPLDKENDSLKEEADFLKSQSDLLEEELFTQQRKVRELHESMRQLKNLIFNLKSELKRESTIIKKLESKSSMSINQTKQLEQELIDSKQKSDKLINKILQIDSINIVLKEQLNWKNEEIDNLIYYNMLLKKEIDKLIKDYNFMLKEYNENIKKRKRKYFEYKSDKDIY